MNDKSLIVGALVLIVAVGGILYAVSGTQSGTVTGTPTTTSEGGGGGPNLALAQCLKDSGVVFYGAFWCPHCKAQKAEFGDAAAALPYVECSTADGNAQTPICITKKINSYPTWVFPDGGRLSGDQSLATLSASSSCPMPGAVSSTTTTTKTGSSSSLAN